MESIETKYKNLLTDISGVIQREFYVFIKENPDWYKGADWQDPMSSYRFLLQANASTEKIKKLIEGCLNI